MQEVRDLAGRDDGAVVGRLAGTALTVIPQSLGSGAWVRLYWRIWRAPSGSATWTDMYWPGRACGQRLPSGGPSTKDTVSGDS